MTRAGSLSAMVEIQEGTESRSSTGEIVKTYTRKFRAWAKVDSMDTSERFQGDREVGYKLKLFTIRSRRNIGPQDRILYKDESYNIRSIKELDRYGRERFAQILGEIVEEGQV